jgi:hypothetical protein
MRPVILIVETRPDVAEALQEVVTSARYSAMVRPHVDCLADLGVTPAAIIVRIAFEGVGEPQHVSVARLRQRPPVIAIAWEDAGVAEAVRMRCDVVLKAPDDVGRLFDALTAVIMSTDQLRTSGASGQVAERTFAT